MHEFTECLGMLLRVLLQRLPSRRELSKRSQRTQHRESSLFAGVQLADTCRRLLLVYSQEGWQHPCSRGRAALQAARGHAGALAQNEVRSSKRSSRRRDTAAAGPLTSAEGGL